MAKLALFAVLTLATIAGCSPFGGSAFRCMTDQQCTQQGGTGTCESTGYCAFPDPACTPPLRYGDLSGSLSGQCVGGGNEIDAKVYLDAPAMSGSDAPMMKLDSGSSDFCYGNGLGVSACFATAPSGTVTVQTAVNTNPGSADCSNATTNTSVTSAWCVIAGGAVTVNTVAVTGSRPLVIIATATLTVSGTLDIASHRAGVATDANQVGAGSIPTNDATACDPGAVPGVSGGGAGGSFGTKAGNGGDPNHGNAGGAKTTTTLRGGCYGQDGNGINPGKRGVGGGAVYLFASTSISLTGTGLINASGAAGTGGVANNSGAGGGGSGGLIALDSPMITNGGVVFANGGGGAEGSGNATTGNSGTEPAGVAASGPSGSASGLGGDGGTGAAQGTNAANGANGAGGGGGGGGGGVGIIKVFGGGSLTGSVSPNPS